jgi:hypothetical protein
MPPFDVLRSLIFSNDGRSSALQKFHFQIPFLANLPMLFFTETGVSESYRVCTPRWLRFCREATISRKHPS